MDKEFVPYPFALRLKQIGFDEPCFGFYYMKEINLFESCKIHERRNSSYVKDYMDKEDCTAPTFSQAIDFIQKFFGLYAEFPIDKTSYPKYVYQYSKFNGNPKDLTEKEWGWEETIISEFLYKDKYEAMKAYLEVILKKTTV